jgi:hypothetical protein
MYFGLFRYEGFQILINDSKTNKQYFKNTSLSNLKRVFSKIDIM